MSSSRRFFLASTAALTGSLLVDGCALLRGQSNPGIAQATPNSLPLIDVHNHIFNGSDLPTVRFIKIVVLQHYPQQARRVLDIDDPDALDGLLAVLIRMIELVHAPSAAEEISVLDNSGLAVEQNTNSAANENEAINAVAEFVGDGSLAPASSTRQFRAIRSAIFKASGEDRLASSDAAIRPDQAKQVAARAYRSQFDLGLLLRWFALFTRYRYALAEQLVADHASQDFEARLLCPAMIDFDHWLGERVDDSPLPAQVEVMGRLARRKSGPVVHGYVAYDPLRQALFEAGMFRQFDPLYLVQTALREEGFIGVKVYPPMGFKPFGNSDDPHQAYPDIRAINELICAPVHHPTTATCDPHRDDASAIVSKYLDKAMADLFDLCVAEDATILAHANDSNAASQGASNRADPAYWLPVFGRWPALRVGLAHFGPFAAHSVAAPAGSALPESSWEWTFGRYIAGAGDPPVFADISYLNEITQRSPAELSAYAATFRRWIAQFDPGCHHLMFGTDWTMLGRDPAYAGYTARVHAFFKDACSFSPAMMERLFYGNAARFLGIREGDGARKRLLAFYDRNGIARSRLPSFPDPGR